MRSYIHGTLNGYVNRRCRCAKCTEANRVRAAAEKAKREPLSPDDYRHGTTNAYGNYRCRCAACRRAWATYMRGYNARRRATS